jgi:potassium-dependent mechanosensitive channel
MPRREPGESPGVKIFASLFAIGFALVAPQQLQAQVSALKKALEGKADEKPAPQEKPDDVRKRLELWNQEASDTLARLDSAGAAVALPAGVTPSELEDRRRDLEQMALLTAAHLKNLGSLGDARKAAESARAEDAEWSSFEQTPPFSILMIDSLLNDRDSIKTKLASYESSLANFQSILANTLNETKAAEDAVSNAIVAVQNSAPEMQDAAKWRLEAARARARLLATRASHLQSACETAGERIAAGKAELALVERKIRIAAPNSRFTEDDLTRIGKIADERRQAINKDIVAVSKRLKSTIATRTQAQAALDALQAAATVGKEPEGLTLAKFRVEVADIRVESQQSVIESLESLVQMESLGHKAYQNRRVIMTTKNAEERGKALTFITTYAERLGAWLRVQENELASASAELSKIEYRAASITSEDPRFSLINEQRAACSEKLATLQRVTQAVVSQRKLVERWVADFTPKSGDKSFFERVSAIGVKTWSAIRKLWSFEVTSYVEEVEVGGQTFREKVPVTLGSLLRALLFFVIGYWIAARIARRIQQGIVSRGHIAEAQARTLRNWAMIVVGLFLALGTLSFLKIPLTVFAFFGGALAIGVGFGTQTLIKNFISGIIVLVERKIRVGDVLDVDGIVGTVTEVNTRSSIIRSGDDVETMIPNSLFLENRVTNWTLSSAKMRRSLRVSAAHGSEPKDVMEILTEAAGRHGLVCKDPAPFATFDDFGDSALVFSLYYWVDLHSGANPMMIASDLRLIIGKRLAEAGIGVPYPQRDMHLTTDQPIDVRITQS